MKEIDFAKKIHSLGGELYIVGGWVRDKIRKSIPKDKDFLICHLDEEIFKNNFPEAIKIGKSFPVYKLAIDSQMVDIAFARKEKKTGVGYKGFSSISNPKITLQEDLSRRDTSMNALAYRVIDNKIIDYFNGIKDIQNRTIKAISNTFIDDPVRSLRACRQACEFDFIIDKNTIDLMKLTKNELSLEPTERIWKELERVLLTKKPSFFFTLLNEATLLDIIFPEIYNLFKYPQNDNFNQTMKLLDKVSQYCNNPIIRFAALTHKLGNHNKDKNISLEILNNWNNRMTIPKKYLKLAKFFIKESNNISNLKNPSIIVDLLLSINKLGINYNDFNILAELTHNNLPIYLIHYEKFLKAILEINGNDCPEEIKGSQISIWIKARQIEVFQQIYDNIKFK